MGEVIKISRTPSIANDEPILAEGAGVRVIDIVDRVRAGDSIEEVAKDFGVRVESVRLLMEVADAVSEGEREIARRECKRVHQTENAARELWEAATEVWLDDDEEWSLSERLFDCACVYPAVTLKGKELYRIGVALGFIEEHSQSEEGEG